jgi:hypothetical protein
MPKFDAFQLADLIQKRLRMPRQTITTKIARMKTLIARLEQGEDVQARDILVMLTADQKTQYEAAWAEQQELRALKKPDDIIEYERLLNKALMLDGRAEQYTPRKMNGKAVDGMAAEIATTKLRASADRAFEHALSRLEEVVTVDPTLRVWLDRDLDFGIASLMTGDAHTLPHVITSKSASNLAPDGIKLFGKKTKTEIKIEALKYALAEALLTQENESQKMNREAAESKVKAELTAKLASLKKPS